MITSNKLFVLLTGSAAAAVMGVGPAVSSDMPLTLLFAAGAGTVTAGIHRMVVRPVAEH